MATALIKLEQGATTDVAGRALLGSSGGGNVDISNDDNTGITSWTITLLDAPVRSSLSPGVLASGADANPVATLVHDGAPGCYRIQLEVSDGVTTDKDIRNFAIPNEEGVIFPPFQGNPKILASKPNELNFGGQSRGWMGDGTYKMVDWALGKASEDVFPSGGDEGDYLRKVSSAEVALSYPRNVVTTGDGGWILANGPAVSTAQSNPAYLVAPSIAYSADGLTWSTKAYDVAGHYPTQVIYEPVTGKTWALVEDSYTVGNFLWWREIISTDPLTFGASEYPVVDFTSPNQQQAVTATAAGGGLIIVGVNSSYSIVYDASTTPPTAIANTSSSGTFGITLFWDPTDRYGDGNGRLYLTTSSVFQRWSSGDWSTTDYVHGSPTVDGINTTGTFYGWAGDVTSGVAFFVGRNSGNGRFHLFKTDMAATMFTGAENIEIEDDTGASPIGLTVDHATGNICVLFKASSASYVVFANWNGSSFSILGTTNLDSDWLADGSGYAVSPAPPSMAQAAFAGGQHVFPLNGLPYGSPPSPARPYVVMVANPDTLELTATTSSMTTGWQPSTITLAMVLDNGNSAQDQTISDLGNPVEDEDAVPRKHLRKLATPFSVAGMSEKISSSPTLPINVRGMYWRPDGLRMYTIYYDNVVPFEMKVYEYQVSSPYDVTTLSYTGSQLDILPQMDDPTSLVFSEDGHYLYVTVQDNPTVGVFQYNLGTAFNLSTASYSGNYLNLFAGGFNSVRGIQISSDGTKLMLCGQNLVFSYQMGTPYNLSTASYTGNQFTPDVSLILDFRVGSTGGSPSPEVPGTKLLIQSNDAVPRLVQYTLGTAWNPSTAVFDDVAQSQEFSPAISYSTDGTLLIKMAYNGSYLFETYRLAVPVAETETPTLAEVLGEGASAGSIEITSLGAPTAPTSAARLSDITTLTPNSQTGTSYTLAVSDVGKCIVCDNASPFTLTIPKVSVVALPVNSVIYVYQKGAGQVTVSPVDGTVTIDTNARFQNRAAGQSAMLMLWHRASNVWTLTGEREAV